MDNNENKMDIKNDGLYIDNVVDLKYKYNLPNDIWILIYDFVSTNILRLLNKNFGNMLQFRHVRKIITSGNIGDNFLIEKSKYIHNLSIKCERLETSCFPGNMNFKNIRNLKIEGSDLVSITIYYLELIKNEEIQNLIEISLDISDPKFVGDKLENIKILNKLHSLEIVCLKLRRRNIDDNIFKLIMESLQNNNINKIQFDFVASNFMKVLFI